jgi:tRNA-guanine family transglycosylase
MEYYVSWTHSDPVYQQYFPNVRALVSPPNVNLAWNTSRWLSEPSALILDSGAYQYHRERRTIGPETVFHRQLAMLASTAIPAGICHLDIPMMGTRNVAELDRRVEQSLSHARWLIEYTRGAPLPDNVHPIGVIQGYSVERIYFVAQALEEMGYTMFALGSLAGMVANARDELLRRVEAALEAVGSNIHILGVSAASTLSDLARLGITSADSGAPILEASRGGLFYSKPFRRYKLSSPYFKEWSRSYSFAEIIDAPLACDCPVCLEDSSRLMEQRGKTFVNLRAIHNYYHLTRELAATAMPTAI